MKEYNLRYTTPGQIFANHPCAVCNYMPKSNAFCVNNCIFMLNPSKVITAGKFRKLLNLVQEVK